MQTNLLLKPNGSHKTNLPRRIENENTDTGVCQTLTHIVKLGGVTAVREGHFAIVIIANICSEHSVQAVKGGNVAVKYSGEGRTCISGNLSPIPYLRIMPPGFPDFPLHNYLHLQCLPWQQTSNIQYV